MIKAVIFDFDGVILDTETPAYDSWQEVYQEHGCTLPCEFYAKILGGSGHEFDACAYLSELSGKVLNVEAIKERRQRRKMELIELKTILPGVLEAIVYAREKGPKLAVASSSPRGWVLPHLERLEVAHYFETVVTGDQVSNVKPDPEIYLEAVARLGVEPREAVAFEDSLNGLQAAKNAGLFCVAVPNALTWNLDFSRADIKLKSLADVPLERLLTRLNRTTYYNRT